MPSLFVKAETIIRGRLVFIEFAYLPPEGTQKGDIMYGDHLEGWIVQSPLGEVRGCATMITMTPEQAIRIRERVKDRFYSTHSQLERD